jgi:NADH:ubiquinone oxidoreductase subunit 6 (subunit J)
VRDIAIWIVLALATVAQLTLLWGARRRGALVPIAAGIAAVLITGWLIVLTLINTDETGAGGAFDCWPYCSLYQDVIAVAFFGLPIQLVVLIIAVGLMGAIYLARRSR